MTRPASSVQFVGAIEMRAAQGSGTGVIIGEECAINAAGPYCGDPAAAKISTTLESNSDGATTGLQGEIEVTAATGTETWQIDLGLWPDNELATIPWTGQLKELLAEFASADEKRLPMDREPSHAVLSCHSRRIILPGHYHRHQSDSYHGQNSRQVAIQNPSSTRLYRAE